MGLGFKRLGRPSIGHVEWGQQVLVRVRAGVRVRVRVRIRVRVRVRVRAGAAGPTGSLSAGRRSCAAAC